MATSTHNKYVSIPDWFSSSSSTPVTSTEKPANITNVYYPDLSGFITKDYIDGKFVTFDLDETIDGIKTFTNGIKIGTSLINQS